MDADLTEREAIELRDEAAAAEAAAEAAASYLDAKEGSEELIKRLESQRIGDRNKKHDFGFNFDPVATNDEPGAARDSRRLGARRAPSSRRWCLGACRARAFISTLAPRRASSEHLGRP